MESSTKIIADGIIKWRLMQFCVFIFTLGIRWFFFSLLKYNPLRNKNQGKIHLCSLSSLAQKSLFSAKYQVIQNNYLAVTLRATAYKGSVILALVTILSLRLVRNLSEGFRTDPRQARTRVGMTEKEAGMTQQNEKGLKEHQSVS